MLAGTENIVTSNGHPLRGTMPKRILIIEDDPEIAELLQEACSSVDCEVTVENDGKEGLDRALAEKYSMVILDIGLPTVDGYEVCRTIRKENEDIAILMVTSRSEEIDKILGLEFGADDYITKPFSIRELAARVKALLRRVKEEGSTVSKDGSKEDLNYGDLQINFTSRRVTLDGEEVDLTAIQFELLAFLADSPDRVFTREDLMEAIWGYNSTRFDATITSHMSRLRGKLERDPNNPEFIETVRGVGYRFVKPT